MLHIECLEILVEAVGELIEDGDQPRKQCKHKDNTYDLCSRLSFALHDSPP